MANPGDGKRAEEMIRKRQEGIAAELNQLEIYFAVKEVLRCEFVSDAALGDQVVLATPRGQIGIVLADGVPEVLNGEVRLDVQEKYAYDGLSANPAAGLTNVGYSYTISYMQELMIDPGNLPRTTAGDWGELLLTQRRYFRFDGNDRARSGQDVAHRNQHPPHHLHSGVERYLRFPIARQPSVLSVACFGLVSFRHDRWLELATKAPAVLAATRELLPNAAIT